MDLHYPGKSFKVYGLRFKLCLNHFINFYTLKRFAFKL